MGQGWTDLVHLISFFFIFTWVLSFFPFTRSNPLEYCFATRSHSRLQKSERLVAEYRLPQRLQYFDSMMFSLPGVTMVQEKILKWFMRQAARWVNADPVLNKPQRWRREHCRRWLREK
jgi:hypothetical protein